MLAVVCKSYATACTLEKYKEHGDIDHSGALHAIAAELGKSIDGRFDVICLEGIRPYGGKIEDGPHRMLALADPVLPTGNIPPGFIGYAVNMINLDAHKDAGLGLRETLFYHLFGELQVYETRKYMKKACSSIKHGAVSLDGGIMRGNGVFSYGAGEPKVCFPVVDVLRQLSSQSVSILKEITLKESELEATSDEIKKESKRIMKLLWILNRKRTVTIAS